LSRQIHRAHGFYILDNDHRPAFHDVANRWKCCSNCAVGNTLLYHRAQFGRDKTLIGSSTSPGRRRWRRQIVAQGPPEKIFDAKRVTPADTCGRPGGPANAGCLKHFTFSPTPAVRYTPFTWLSESMVSNPAGADGRAGSVFSLRAASARITLSVFAMNKLGTDPEMSERAFADFVQKYPNSTRVPEAILYQAQARLLSGHAAAPSNYSRPYRADKLAPQYFIWLGQARFQNNDFQGAADTFGEMLQKYPEAPQLSTPPSAGPAPSSDSKQWRG